MQLNVPEYNKLHGFIYDWEDGFTIRCTYSKLLEKGEVFIRANSEGLVSLARHLLELAQSTVPAGEHIHLDEFNSLEDGSVELVIEKV